MPKLLVIVDLHHIHLHKLAGHPGIHRLVLMESCNYIWRSMVARSIEYVRQHDKCNKSNGSVNKNATLKAYPTE